MARCCQHCEQWARAYPAMRSVRWHLLYCRPRPTCWWGFPAARAQRTYVWPHCNYSAYLTSHHTYVGLPMILISVLAGLLSNCTAAAQSPQSMSLQTYPQRRSQNFFFFGQRDWACQHGKIKAVNEMLVTSNGWKLARGVHSLSTLGDCGASLKQKQ